MSIVEKLTDIHNVGPVIAADLRLLEIAQPGELKIKDAKQLYEQLCRQTGKRYDPCMSDTFMAIVDSMRGASACPRWTYTRERKEKYPTPHK